LCIVYCNFWREKKIKRTTKFYGTLDRIEDNTAVLLVGEDGDTIEISKDLLPAGCKEGDLVSFKIELKDKKTKKEKEKIERLIEKLARGTRS
jgi:hypothetical protein